MTDLNSSGESSSMASGPPTAKEDSKQNKESWEVAAWILLLCWSQLAMFIYGKLAMQGHRLPTLLCLVQFGISAVFSTLPSPLTGPGIRGLKLMCREHRPLLIPLGVLWTLGFVLLNASVARLSAALANTVRALEPLSTVALGFIVFGERYSFRLIACLLPISAGVGMASHGGGTLSGIGVLLAGLSNFGFSSRPFLAQRLSRVPGRQLDSTSVFFNVMCIGVVVLLCTLSLAEGSKLLPAMQQLQHEGKIKSFWWNLVCSGTGFFLYQLSQINLMSRMSAITFSVITPMSKAFVIVSCALYFGDPMSGFNITGVAISTIGVLLFTAARRADTAASTAGSVNGKSKTG